MRPGLGRCPRMAHRDEKTTAIYADDAPSPHERGSSERHVGHQGSRGVVRCDAAGGLWSLTRWSWWSGARMVFQLSQVMCRIISCREISYTQRSAPATRSSWPTRCAPSSAGAPPARTRAATRAAGRRHQPPERPVATRHTQSRTTVIHRGHLRHRSTSAPSDVREGSLHRKGTLDGPNPHASRDTFLMLDISLAAGVGHAELAVFNGRFTDDRGPSDSRSGHRGDLGARP